MPAIRDTLPGCRLASKCNILISPARLRGKRSAAAFLASETVTNRDTHRRAPAFYRKFAAATGSSFSHNNTLRDANYVGASSFQTAFPAQPHCIDTTMAANQSVEFA